MGTTADKINRIAQTKEAIKALGNEFGANITNEAFSKYPEKLRGVMGGGGGGGTVTSEEYYLCTSMEADSNTWSGKKANLSDSGYTISSEISSGLPIKGFIPVLNSMYNKNTMVHVSELFKEPEVNYLRFEAGSQNSTVSIKKGVRVNYDILIQVNKNGNGWNSYFIGTEITLEHPTDFVLFRGNNKYINNYSGNFDYMYTFKTTGDNMSVSGSIMTLLDINDKLREVNYTYCFSGLFDSCNNIISAPDLPAKKVSKGCYSNMFYDCSNLSVSPELPATELENNCYSNMFCNSKLTITPILPAEILKEGCYQGMFGGCYFLTEIKEIKAKTLAKRCFDSMFTGCGQLRSVPYDMLSYTTLFDYCYHRMFANCSVLENSPYLPSTTFPYVSCYSSMFENCYKLNRIEVEFTEWNTQNTGGWVQKVGSGGTFVCPATLEEIYDSSHIPPGWTVEKKPGLVVKNDTISILTEINKPFPGVIGAEILANDGTCSIEYVYPQKDYLEISETKDSFTVNSSVPVKESFEITVNMMKGGSVKSSITVNVSVEVLGEFKPEPIIKIEPVETTGMLDQEWYEDFTYDESSNSYVDTMGFGSTLKINDSKPNSFIYYSAYYSESYPTNIIGDENLKDLGPKAFSKKYLSKIEYIDQGNSGKDYIKITYPSENQ